MFLFHFISTYYTHFLQKIFTCKSRGYSFGSSIRDIYRDRALLSYIHSCFCRRICLLFLVQWLIYQDFPNIQLLSPPLWSSPLRELYLVSKIFEVPCTSIFWGKCSFSQIHRNLSLNSQLLLNFQELQEDFHHGAH